MSLFYHHKGDGIIVFMQPLLSFHACYLLTETDSMERMHYTKAAPVTARGAAEEGEHATHTMTS